MSNQKDLQGVKLEDCAGQETGLSLLIKFLDLFRQPTATVLKNDFYF